MIAAWFKTPMQAERSAWGTDGEGNPSSERTVVSSFNGFVEQANAELIARLKLSYTKAYVILCPIGTDVLEGDVVIAEGKRYSVHAKQENTIGQNPHIHLVAELDEVAVT